MANIIRHKRSETPDARPTAAQLMTGELAVNVVDGKLFLKRNDDLVITPVADAVDGGEIFSSVGGTITRTSYGAVFGFDNPFPAGTEGGRNFDLAEFRIKELNWPGERAPLQVEGSFDFTAAGVWDSARNTFRDDGFGIGPIRYHDVLNSLMADINLPEFDWPVTAAPEQNWRLRYQGGVGGLSEYSGFRLVARVHRFDDRSVIYFLQAILLNGTLNVADVVYGDFDSPPSPTQQEFDTATNTFFNQAGNLDNTAVWTGAMSTYVPSGFSFVAEWY